MIDDLRSRIVAAIARHCPDHYDHDWLAAADAVLTLVRPPNEELTREEAVALADDLGQQLYRAQDRVAFVREMLTGRTGSVDVATVLAWLDHQHCPRAESEQQQIARLTAERDEAVRAVQGWMALDLHTALGKPVDHSVGAVHQSHGSWADWWADLCAEVRGQQAPAATVTSHTYEGASGPGQPCQAEAFGETCGATWERHQLRDDVSGVPEHQPRCSGEPGPDLNMARICVACPDCGLTVGGDCDCNERTTLDNPLTSTNTVDNPKEPK